MNKFPILFYALLLFYVAPVTAAESGSSAVVYAKSQQLHELLIQPCRNETEIVKQGWSIAKSEWHTYTGTMVVCDSSGCRNPHEGFIGPLHQKEWREFLHKKDSNYSLRQERLKLDGKILYCSETIYWAE